MLRSLLSMVLMILPLTHACIPMIADPKPGCLYDIPIWKTNECNTKFGGTACNENVQKSQWKISCGPDMSIWAYSAEANKYGVAISQIECVSEKWTIFWNGIAAKEEEIDELYGGVDKIKIACRPKTVFDDLTKTPNVMCTTTTCSCGPNQEMRIAYATGDSYTGLTFRRSNSIWQIRGASLDNPVEVPIPTSLACVDSAGIIDENDKCGRMPVILNGKLTTGGIECNAGTTFQNAYFDTSEECLDEDVLKCSNGVGFECPLFDDSLTLSTVNCI